MSEKIILGRERRFFDGGMGTMLQAAGLAPGESPELWNFTHPEEVRAVHRAYALAGADILTANTFGANRLKLRETGFSVEEVVTRGVALARAAREGTGCRWVALDLGPTGKLLEPLGQLPFEEAVSVFGEMAAAGAKAGADCILIETMTDIYEAKAAVLAARESCDLPVFVTMTFDGSGKLLTGGDLQVMAAVLEGLGVDAMGLNCGLGPKQMLGLVRELRALTDLPLIVTPNAGLPRVENGETFYDVGPEEFAEDLAGIARYAGALGGCCGTTPEHLARMVARCRDLPCPAPAAAPRTVIASGMQAVAFGKRPVIIGERINPTGKKRFKQALREHDLPYLLGEGIAQQDAGAHVLDVNVGLPEIDEKALMCETVRELQAVTPLPLQIDTSDPAAMAAAMRLYNGKPLVNSVTAKESSMGAIFPLVKKYGGVVIGLTITEEGIPETAQGRVDAARKILDTAATYGIPRKDVVIDPLTMAVSAQGVAAQVTLEALGRISRELGAATSLGVSNVSFGLPQRENVTSAFFLLALQNGLNAAIMNPLSPTMMTAYRAYCALAGVDENCMDYIAACADQEAAPTPIPAGGEPTLGEAVEKGLREDAYRAAGKLLAQGTDKLAVINDHIVPALDRVGVRFEEKTLFLPQLLMSAEAAKAAFQAVQESLAGQETAQEDPLRIVLATVKGDVHDIGKNIVRVLLENYGFAVTDLGKDVPPETVLAAVREQDAQLVGLSALMTTTVGAMRDTIQLLHREAPGVRIMVGGAVLTQEYADEIGADFYGKDAMASVRYAGELSKALGLA